MKKIFGLIIVLAGLAIVANGQSVETRKLDNFTALSVGEAIKVKLIPGTRNEAKITASNIDLEDIRTTVVGSKLKIELEGNRYRNIEVEIDLTFTTLESISVSSAAHVTSEKAIKANDLEISVSSAGSAHLVVDAQSLDIDVSSSGELKLQGKTVSQRVGVSSAGEYNAYEMSSDEAYVRASSAGSARVSTNKKIDAKASSAGSVKYKGNPEKVYVSSSSGGSTGKSN